MKLVLPFLLFGLLTACASTTNNRVSSDECGVDELFNGISCIEPDLEAIAKAPLGSQYNPVRADGPSGQREYLSRLVCSNGMSVADFYRLGSAGPSPYGFILDMYMVKCDTDAGLVEHEVYLDMYHKGYLETNAAEGFSIVNE
ncbi:hypothetical protein [Arenicella xantha]|uniref:Lipoprotein n=1 Tax=Arenicella xantha TaxID=644221 RepID=A0A395JSY5_9GAMM|nr:hypothetical protein [Arenicella xantha]RBP53655.1 hypothetical protein DFR28_1011042 [Arenicella xantha]